MNFRKLVFSIFLLCIITSISYSQNPNFELKLTNRNYLSSNLGYFDVVLKHTNFLQTEFRYSSGKFAIILDQSFLPDHLNYYYSKDTSTFGRRRISPNNVGDLIRSGDTLFINEGNIITQGTEPIISHEEGTLIARIRFFNPDLYLNSCLFEEQYVWKLNNSGLTTEIKSNVSGSIVSLQNSLNNFSTNDLCDDQFCCLSVPLTPPVRIFPLNNSINNFWPVKFEWQKGFPVNYSANFQVATDSLFSDILIDEDIERPDGIDPVKFFTSDLEFETDYYWRVKQGGIPPQGAYNESWKFTTGTPSITLSLKVIPESLINKFNFYPFKLKVYLRNSSSPYEIIDSSQAFIKNHNFNTELYFMNAVSGNYYIVLDNGKYLETWSRSGGSFLMSQNLNLYDFSSHSSQAFGNNQTSVGDLNCIFSGDLNNDGLVDLEDISIVENGVFNFVKGESFTDLNNDLITDIEDFAIADRNVFKIVNLISPASH